MKNISNFIILLTGLAVLSGCAGRPGTATKYRPMGLFGGYSEEKIGPDTWQVNARSNGIAERSFGRNMAVYRAAEILSEQGFSYVQILDQKGKSTEIRNGASYSYAGETMELIVRGANSPEPPTDCQAKNPSACMTVNAALTMQRLAPTLYIQLAPTDGISPTESTSAPQN